MVEEGREWGGVVGDGWVVLMVHKLEDRGLGVGDGYW